MDTAQAIMPDVAETVPGNATSPRQTRRTARVIVNEQAGAVLEAGRAAFETRIVEAFAQQNIAADVACVPARELDRTISQAAKQDIDLIVIAGGDGTVSRALPHLLDFKGEVAVLPLGTLNLLGRDLGLTGEVMHDIARIAAGETREVDVALLNGAPFHSNSGLGFFGMMARERENARKRFPFSRSLGFAWAATRTVLFSPTIEVEIDIDGERRTLQTDAVLVTNNRFDGAPWRRERLDEGLLEVHLLEASGLASRIRAAFAMARGDWRSLPSLTTYAATAVTLRRKRKRVSTVATDGEIRRLSNPLSYTVLSRALRMPAGQREVKATDT